MAKDHESEQDTETIPLVVIGASAGGLEPLEAFFEATPLDAGWCFVVVQHLSPDYKSMMHELLSRRSPLAIRHIEDGSKITPNTIFLNRPSTLAMLKDDRFQTRSYEPDDEVPHLPIDSMLSSVAERNPGCTAAVILSGSGSDGTRGAESVHARGGLVLVQSLSEASFPSMPRSIVASEVADRVLPAKELPAALLDFFETGNRNGLPGRSASLVPGPKSILSLLEDAHNIDFTDYKPQNVQRRIERRQHLQGYETIEDYRAELEANPTALEELYHDLLIGVTEFYRDRETMTTLRAHALDRLAAEEKEKPPLRIWVPGCSSGEEAYTLAIELSEALAQAGRSRSFRIIATDVHRRSIDVASAGIYSVEAVRRVPEGLREKYFDSLRDKLVVTSSLRQKIIFSVHDVLSDPPFMNLDMISCRNLLIYLNDAAQARLISMFLFGLRMDGFLLLGSSESLGKFSGEFRTIDSRCRIFQKSSNKRVLDRSMLSAKIGSSNHAETTFRETAVQHKAKFSNRLSDFRNRDSLIRCYDALLKRYAPSSILITEHGMVLAWFGAASIFIDTMNNLAEWTVEDIVHPDLHFVINVAAEKLRQQQLESYARNVEIRFSEHHVRNCHVEIQPLDEVQGSRMMLVALKLEERPEEQVRTVETGEVPDATDERKDDTKLLTKRIVELERDLRLTEETLQHVTERLEASGEELQASNEELQASNEELQASNEELQSSNEELHAVNEELVSVSTEYERQIETLSELNQNIEFVLRSLGVGLIFVDGEARLRRFSEIIASRFQLESYDVMRSVSVIGPRPAFFDLPKAVEAVLASGEGQEFSGEHGGERLTVKIRPVPQVSSKNGETVPGAVLIFDWGGEAPPERRRRPSGRA